MSRSNPFPKKFFLRILIWQLFLCVLATVLTQFFVQIPWFDLIQVFILFSIVALLTSYRLSKSFGRLLTKSEIIIQKDYFSDPNIVEDLTEESSLFEEFERSINRIHKKLKRKSIRILQQQEETEAFLSAVEDSIVVINSHDKIVSFNNHFGIHFLPKDVPRDQLQLTQVFRNPEVLKMFETALKSGVHQKRRMELEMQDSVQRHYFSVHVSPLRKTTNKELYGALGFFHDVTDLKKAEQIRIDFVSNASHELRTPLTSVKGYIETLREDFKDNRLDTAESFLDIVSRNVDRLIDLVNDLLSISKLDSYTDFKLENVDSLTVSHHVMEQLSVLTQEKKQRVYLKSDVGFFKGDARKVEQVILNLVSNAVKYIPEGKTIQIQWRRNDQQDVFLHVIDDGPGIAPEHLERLFERFYRIDKGRARDAGGTGLGLAIVKHIMQTHGGDVEVRSELGKGTEFICYFPQVQS